MNNEMKLYRKTAIDNLHGIQNEAENFYKTSTNFDENHPTFGIEGNTFRAFRNYSLSPSKTYRNWIKENKIIENFKNDINSIDSLSSFKSFHQKLSNNFSEYWFKKQKQELTIAQNFKLIDLFVKYMSRVKINGYKSINKNLCNFGNIPLDKFSFAAIKTNFYGIIISKNPSMGDICDIETYDFIQDQINYLMIDLKLPNLFFDYYAWNKFHD